MIVTLEGTKDSRFLFFFFFAVELLVIEKTFLSRLVYVSTFIELYRDVFVCEANISSYITLNHKKIYKN